ncbi:MAG: 5-methylthioadenosine/S-adenosylhomocysteine deaminase [Nitrospirae bacterium]|nr:MAG: 5-methylthioadenosine/S-adenosylhomocysteine deaminase [Nitrospirota bacterium]
MQSIDTLLCGDTILTMNDTMDVLQNGAVAVHGGDILAVGSYPELIAHYAPKTVVDGKGKVLLPGFVNAHCHAAMAYFRGLADDMHLKEWLEQHIWPAENRLLNPEFVADSAELACLEMLKGGITTVNDMYFFGGATARSAKNMGMRAVVGAGIVDFPTVAGNSVDDYLAKAEEFIRQWSDDPLVSGCIAPHSAYACGSDTLRRVKEMADRLGCLIHLHVSETAWEVSEIQTRFGKRPVEYLESIGMLAPNVVAVHCVWLDDAEIEIFARRGVGVAHCIESNLKLASGVAPVAKMLKAGVKVAFGTDGAASNNDLNMLGEISTAAKVHKALAADPTVLDAKTALRMATRVGAEVLGLCDRVGSLEPGKRADIISFDMRKPHLSPLYDPYSHIVYAALPSDIDLVMVDGNVLVQGGRAVACDETSVLARAEEWKAKISPTGGRI